MHWYHFKNEKLTIKIGWKGTDIIIKYIKSVNWIFKDINPITIKLSLRSTNIK